MKLRFTTTAIRLFFMGICMVVLIGASSVHAATASRGISLSSCKWSIVSSPNISSTLNNQLNGIAAITAQDIWAVGFTQSNSNDYRSLAEHWDGKKWRVIATPNLHVQSSPLYAVSADATNDVWAVGLVAKYRQSSAPLIEHWNGTSWSVVASPSLGTYDALFGVTALAANNVWVVGESNNYADVLIEHWDGTQWSIIPGVNPNNVNNFFEGISAVSANDIWAVGSQYLGTLTEHWNGTKWSIVSSANVQNDDSLLLSVSASSSTNVWAVGYVVSYHQTLIERWDGTKWSLIPGIPPSPHNDVQLNGVVALANNSVWMAGYTGLEGKTLIGHWNGTKWSQISSPNLGTQNNDLQAIAKVPGSNQLLAVGFYYSPNISYFSRTLIESYC